MKNREFIILIVTLYAIIVTSVSLSGSSFKTELCGVFALYSILILFLHALFTEDEVKSKNKRK